MKIFSFGGSTMFGFGSPDWGTIPAYLAEILNTRFSEKSIEVINFGQGSWITSQEVIQLIEEIKHGNVPDIVVFYDGVNDLGQAYTHGKAGIPLHVHESVPVFVEETQFQRFVKLGLNLNSVKLVKDGFYKIFGYPIADAKARGIKDDELVQDTVHTYLQNMDVVDALAEKYGFDYYFFWQPQWGAPIFSTT